MKYVEAFKNDIRWLGFKWDEELYASDYFERLYEFGELLVKKGSAYVDSQTDDGDPDHARYRNHAGDEQPLPRPLGRGESRPAAAHARR